jgi:NADH-quinone oxidoreductase subunit D
MHRGFEKLAEHRDYRQIMALVNRHDWLSGFSNELGVALAVEKMLEMEVPDRAQWIRMLIAEWNRILNHLMFIGSYAIELGAITPMFYAFREREDIQHLLESATGGGCTSPTTSRAGSRSTCRRASCAVPRGLALRVRAARLLRPGPRQRDLPGPDQGRRPAAARTSPCRSA